MTQETAGLYLCYYASQKFWKKLCVIVFTSMLLTIAYFTKKQFGFQFESKQYTLGVFVDLSKAFDTVKVLKFIKF